MRGALTGAAVGGSVGAGFGFAAGSINALAGVLAPKEKDEFYGAIEKGGDWLVDKAEDIGKSVGKAAKGAWKNVTSCFGGKKYGFT
ncbi:MAG: hypothetical protein L0I48_01000 [Lactococcus plantarum]|nr:hypothetical protein [Lactococcus plantarum]MDN6085626.1 hypothetical protein [Lactococcus plantarum]